MVSSFTIESSVERLRSFFTEIYRNVFTSIACDTRYFELITVFRMTTCLYIFTDHFYSPTSQHFQTSLHFQNLPTLLELRNNSCISLPSNIPPTHLVPHNDFPISQHLIYLATIAIFCNNCYILQQFLYRKCLYVLQQFLYLANISIFCYTKYFYTSQ